MFTAAEPRLPAASWRSTKGCAGPLCFPRRRAAVLAAVVSRLPERKVSAAF